MGVEEEDALSGGGEKIGGAVGAVGDEGGLGGGDGGGELMLTAGQLLGAPAARRGAAKSPTVSGKCALPGPLDTVSRQASSAHTPSLDFEVRPLYSHRSS